MEVDKQLKFKSHRRMQVEFISNNVDVMTHDCLSSVALALEAGEQGVSLLCWMLQEMESERERDVVEHSDGNVCSGSWYRLRTHLGRLDERSVVYNTALMGAWSYGRGTAQAREQVEHWGTVCEGSVVF